MKQLRIHCTKVGIRVNGANNIGSTCDNVVSSKRDFMRVAEHWWNTYCESGGNFEREPEERNAVAMREALKTVKRYLDGYTVNVLEMRSQVDAALAAPQRNCDVGTATEQAKRMREYCFSKDSLGCPNHCLHSLQAIDCFCEWGQMPYNEKGGAK